LEDYDELKHATVGKKKMHIQFRFGKALGNFTWKNEDEEEEDARKKLRWELGKDGEFCLAGGWKKKLGRDCVQWQVMFLSVLNTQVF
jgi:hypothetical protein